MKTCVQCGGQFEVSAEDREFYKKMDVPEPKLCPDCRMQRIICFRNERKLYKRTCDFSGKNIISIYPTKTEFPVYHPDVWWSDRWDPLEYGRDVDFTRPFFEQIAALQKKVPKIALMARNCENSEYVNNEEAQKSCYMTFAGGFCEDCYYSRLLLHSRDCMDCLNTSHAELCYECVNVYESYHCVSSQDLKGCRDIYFSQDLIGCQDCIACIGLRNKKYHIFNIPHSRVEYERLQAELLRNYREKSLWYLQKFQELQGKIPRRYAQIINSQDCSGDYIMDCKNCTNCFDVRESEDCVRIQDGQYCKNCTDCFLPYEAELSYQTMGVCLNSYHCVGSLYCWTASEAMYCQHCFYSSYLFGCIGLKRKKYCILNKEYSKEQYEKLLPKIIEHMKKTGEWGEFFPITLSPFAYNETVAQDYFPLSRKEVEERGWHWKEEERHDFPEVTKKISTRELPSHITDIPDDILDWALQCIETGRLFKIQKGELAFYRKMSLPIPSVHHDVRHQRRMQLRNPRKLWRRTCHKCGMGIQTTYAPDRPEIVYCERCYLQAVN